MQKKKQKVYVAMSGGVDSSVAAALLKRDCFDVVGVYMKCWDAQRPFDPAERGGLNGCTSLDDERSARLAASHLKIPFYTWNFIKEYKKQVVEYMLEGYKKGITPNPDIMCNREIKFGLFFDKAMKLGADYIATGHYARVRWHPSGRTGGSPTPAVGARLRSRRENSHFVRNQASHASEGFSRMDASSPVIVEGVDKNKDQSYFLAFINPRVLSKVLFPVGNYTKPEVRTIAKKIGLPNAERKDSQGICFIGKLDFDDFLRRYIRSVPGNIVTVQGKSIGEHQGLNFYTIGQRKGIGLSGGPYYVVRKDFKRNRLYVSKSEKDLFTKRALVSSVNWFIDLPKQKESVVEVRIRYRTPLAPAKIVRNNKNTYELVFQKGQRAITPGQFAVFYKGEELLGGGVIQSSYL